MSKADLRPYERLEEELAAWAGTTPDRVVACSSGTAALHLALEVVCPRPGSQVLIPDYTMVACARAATLANHVPVFAACRPADLLLDVDALEQHCTSAWDGSVQWAVMPVHVYGRRCSMDEVHRVARLYFLKVIEDLAEAHGVRPHPDSHAACWSFYRNKIVAGEEGGAVAFRNAEDAARARSLRCLGFTPNHDYTHIPRGHNYRLADLLAQPIRASLAEVEENTRRRRLAEGWYDVYCPAEWRMPRRDAVWVYDFRMPGMTAEQQAAVVGALHAAGVAARYGFKPMHQQPEYARHRRYGGEEAARAATEVIYLPCTPGAVTELGARMAFDTVKQALGRV